MSVFRENESRVLMEWLLFVLLSERVGLFGFFAMLRNKDKWNPMNRFHINGMCEIGYFMQMTECKVKERIAGLMIDMTITQDLSPL